MTELAEQESDEESWASNASMSGQLCESDKGDRMTTQNDVSALEKTLPLGTLEDLILDDGMTATTSTPVGSGDASRWETRLRT